ncbi:unnamed protein product [Ambrosiozyma monospora]|uniref:Unnamed protein product n=1 Tax=Ambrosiozyma monospora TaxID=43982 RepID=A0ACB5SSD0_AMBMO|nr:unnamed protein product [Ambrosiozyma monospora]
MVSLLTFLAHVLEPSREIVLHLLTQPDFKYLTALAALYIRLTFDSVDVYKVLEPLLNDQRRLNCRLGTVESGNVSVICMDQFVEQLLTQMKFADLMLPRIVSRIALEDQGLLDWRRSEVESEFEEWFDSDREMSKEDED